MRPLILLISILALTSVKAQNSTRLAFVDSVTYQCFLNDDWNTLIQIGQQAVNQGIDFKYLEQRIGYAYYQKRNFYASMHHYEKALKYDPTDQGTLTYLYFSGLETGNTAYARCWAEKFTTENKMNYHQKALRPVSGLDYEYNYQWNSELYRSNPSYQRIGISTDLGYTLSLYQTLSRFKQDASSADDYNDYRSNILQNEYYVLLSKQFTANLGLDVGYHYLFTKFHTEIFDRTLQEVTEALDTLSYHGNLWFAGLHYKWNRFHFGLNSSYMSMEYNHVLQTGLNVGFALPGTHNLFLNNSLWVMKDDYDQWLVSKHSLGLLLVKKFWLEGYQTFGNLTNFTDLNGMYVYNSFDPTLSRTGLSLFWYATPHLTLFSNYTVETKNNTFLNHDYQQNSLTGGILWKL
jgi:hypothetical protein